MALPSSQPTLIIVSDEPMPVIDRMLALPALDPPFRCEQLRTLAEVSPLHLEPGQTVILYRTATLEHLKSLLLFSREYRRQIRERAFVLMALNSVEHPQISELLTRMGCEEILFTQRVRPRSLKARIDRKFKSWLAPELTTPPEGVRILAPLPLVHDCWLFRGPDDARRVGDLWNIDLIGPGPSIGAWKRVSSDGAAGGLWRWTPAEGEEEPDFCEPGASWVFAGKRPEFRDYHWSFSSKAPQLTYFRGDRAVGHRFALAGGDALALAANSEAAKRKWGAIRSSILREYHLSPDSEAVPNPFDASGTRTDGTAWRDFLGLNQKEEERQAALFHEIERSLGPNPELFKLVYSEAARESYLKELLEDQHVALIWSKGQKDRISAQIDAVDIRRSALSLRLPPETTAERVLWQMQASRAARFYINVSLKRASLFFVIPVGTVAADKGLLRIEIPPSLYEVQRRSYFRLDLPQSPGLFAQLDGIPYQITNLGGGGMAVQARNPDPSDLERGQAIYNISFQINSEIIQCSGEVRWSRPPDPDLHPGHHLIGVGFRNLPEADQQRINLYVLEESFDYLVRTLGAQLGAGSTDRA